MASATPEIPDIIHLNDTHASIALAPSAGGLLMQWTVDGKDIIHWPRDPDWTPPHRIRGGDPLLFPFIARHYVDGRLGFWKDAAGVVRAMPMHGFARDLPFGHRVDDDGLGVVLTLQDSAATHAMYPFGFVFAVHYRLSGATLEVRLVTTNTGAAPMPYYPGHHFYFDLPARHRGDTMLHLPANTVQQARPHGGVTEPVPGAAAYSLADPQLLDRFHVLHEPGLVHLDMPWRGARVTLDLSETACPWYAVTTWTEGPDSDFYCVEPWLGLPDAIHHGQGLRWLQPGQTEEALCRLSVSAFSTDAS
jgi:galactose mutarotase-like enzyme